jgi:hypothetical protein
MRFARSAVFIFFVILATFVLNLVNRDWSRTVDRARPAQRSSDCRSYTQGNRI